MNTKPPFADKTNQLIRWAHSFDEGDLLESTFRAMQLSIECNDFCINVLEFMHPKNTPSNFNLSDHKLNSRLQDIASKFFESDLRRTHTALVPHTTVESLFKGQLETHYLAALCVARPAITQGGQKMSDFISHLRRWIFICSLFNALSKGILLEKNAKIAARFLRKMKFIDKESQLLVDLYKSITNESELDFATTKLAIIDFRNRNSLEYSNSKSTKAFLNSLFNLATNALEPIRDNNTISVKPILEEVAPLSHHFNLNNPDEDPDIASCDELIFEQATSYAMQELSENSFYRIAEESKAHLHWSSLSISPTHIIELRSFIGALYENENEEHRIAATLLNLSLELARTYLFIENLRISDESTEDWSINPKTLKFHRLRTAYQNWIDPSEHGYPTIPFNHYEYLELTLQDKENIATLMADQDIKFLGEAWLRLANIPFSKWLILQDERFQNIWSGVRIRNTGLNTFFYKTHNPTQVSLLGFHKGLKLPASSAYLSFNNSAQRPVRSYKYNSGQVSSINAAGSALCVKDEDINLALSFLNEAVAADPKNTIEYHNLYTARTVLALLASTGARFVEDPFESLAHFDLTLGAVYVNDKNVKGRGGRLAPLNNNSISHVQNYIEHLKAITNSLSQCELKEQLKNILETSHHQSSVPFFFFLTPEYDWQSVKPSNVLQLMNSATAFYRNTFRHRFAQELSEVNHEVLHAWLGHQYTSFPHYGTESLRCYSSDLESLKCDLDTLNHHIDLKPCTSKLIDIPEATHTPKVFTEASYGIAARREKLKTRTKQKQDKARRDIERLCLDQPLYQLSEDKLSELISAMTRHPDGHPHHDAALRYDVLLDIAKQETLVTGKHISINRRFLRPPQDPLIFNDNTLLAAQAFKQMKSAVLPYMTDKTASQLSATQSAFFAAIHLALEHQISDKDFLTDLINVKNIVLHKLKGCFYLLHLAPAQEAKSPNQCRPRKRTLISVNLARFVSRALDRQQPSNLKDYRTIKGAERCFDILKNYRLINSQTPEDLISAISYCTKQYNLVYQPGHIAAHLDQASSSPPLNTYDWLRIEHQLELKEVGLEEIQLPDDLINKENKIVIGEADENIQESDLLEHSKSFYHELGSILKSYSGGNRKEIAKSLIEITRQYDGKVASTLLWFGYWLSEKTRQGKSERTPYTQSTLQTYFSALGHTLFETAYTENLSTLDSEDREELYAEALEAYHLKNSDAKYFLNLLKDFDTFLPVHHMQPINWSVLDELPVDTSPWACIVRESEYLECLRNLVAVEDISTAAMAILSYRFSLRPIEAAGLPRQDLHFTEHTLHWIDVRHRGTQTLKTNNAKRRIVSLFDLCEEEEQILFQAKLHYEAQPNTQQSSFLFPGNITLQQIKAKKSRSANTIKQVLQQITKNPITSCYALRHSYYNAIFCALTNQDKHCLSPFTTTSSETIRSKLLGSTDQHSDFRSAVALARLMGHKSLKAGFNNYNHFVPVLITQRQSDYSSTASLKKTTELDSLTKPFELAKTISPVIFNHDVVNLLQFMRLLGQGAESTAAATSLNIDQELAEEICRCLRETVSDMKFAKKNDEKNLRKESQILARIPHSRWPKLLKLRTDINALNTTNATILEEKEFKQLPFMLGKVRNQIILHHEWQFELLSQTLALYGIPPSEISLTFATKGPALEKWVGEHQFNVIEKRPIDKCLFLNDYGDVDQKKIYAVLVMSGRGDAPLKTGFDIFIAMLANAYSQKPN